MAKRSMYEMRKQILTVIKEETLAYSQIERKLSTNPNTVKMHCQALEEEGLVKIKTVEKDPSNGRKSYRISITPAGLKQLKK